jgi:seryl-tRNA synthetase
MLDLKLLENGQYAQEYRQCLSARNMDPTEVDRLVSLNARRKKLTTDYEMQKAEQNRVSEEIAKLKRNKQDATQQLEAMKKMSEDIKRLEGEAQLASKDVQALLEVLPNKTHSSTPTGAGPEDNKIVRTVGAPRKFEFAPKEHSDLGEKLKILDFDRAVKMSGARFSVLRGPGARLERALQNFMLDLHTREHGYTEISVPLMVNSQSLFSTGNFPKFRDDVFHVEGTDYHLIPTAEVPITNMFRDEILEESQLPITFAGFTPCFRSEAGSYGKDTKGLIRQHQFTKVEVVRFVHPDASYEQHELLTSHAEEVLKRLELPYRVMVLSTGDISFSSSKCYDLEVWLPGQNAYREISSCSNFEDFQARRAQIRFRPAGGGKPRFVHTLNGSGLALGRTWLAILENYQREDGSVEIPKVLRPYLDGQSELRA